MAYIAGQEYNGMKLNQAQADRLNSQAAQLAGKKTSAQALAEREAATAKSLQGSKTINNFGATAPEQVAAQTAMNQKYNLAEGTGIAKSLGGLARIAMPARTQELPSSAPTATNPMKEVSARGANTQTFSGSGTSNTPIVINKSQDTTSQFADTRNELVNKQNEALTLDDYFNLSPEQQKIEQLKRGQEANKAVSDLYGNSINDYDTQITEQATQKEAERAKLEAETATKIAENDALLEAQRQQALNSIESAARQRQETAANTMAFQGFGRSTKAVEVQDQIAADRQAQIAELESKFTAAKAEYKAKLLDTIDEKLKVYDENMKDLRSEKSKVEAEKLKQQGEIIKDLIKNDPTNPTNMLNTYDKLSTIKLNYAKFGHEVEKDAQDAAQKSFQFMINSFGSAYVNNLSKDELINLSSNLGVSPQTLANLPKTVYEIKQEWDEAKYQYDKEFEVNKMTWQNQMDLEKIGIQFNNDMQKLYLGEQFKSDIDRQKYANLGYGTFAGQANNADGSSLYFDTPTTVNNKTVVASNPKLVNAYPAGYRKAAGSSGLGGQCAYEAQQMVDCPKLGNTLQEKLNSLSRLVQQGRAFYKGQGQPQVGYTIISNDSQKYGHVSVVNSIKPDGTLVLTEFNRAAPLTFSNTREIKPNDQSIYGFIATKPKAQYQVAKNVQQLTEDATSKNPMALIAGGLINSTELGRNAGQIGTGIMKYFGVDKGLIQQVQNDEAAFDAGQQDEAGQSLTADRQAVRAGVELPAETVKNLAQYNPQAYQQYMQDLAYSKKNAQAKPADATEIRQVRKEYNTVAQKTQDINQQGQNLVTTWDAYKSGRVGAQVADNALIMTFSKMLDPGSVVREGEFDRVVKGQPLLQYAQNFVNAQAKGGYALDDNTRGQLVTLAQEFMANQNKKMQSLKDFYDNEASYLGVEPSRITGGYNWENQLVSTDTSDNNDPLGLGFSTGQNDPLGLGL